MSKDPVERALQQLNQLSQDLHEISAHGTKQEVVRAYMRMVKARLVPIRLVLEPLVEPVEEDE